MPFRSWSGRFAAVGAPILALGLSGLAACAPDLGPAAQVRPIADYASARSIALVAPAVAAWPAEDWWKAYNDPQLTALIEQALKASPDLKAVQARVREAQAQADQARAVLGPNASAKGSVEATGVKLNFPNTPQQIQDLLPTSIQPFTEVSASVNYQLDFFGRNRAAVAAASSTAQAAAFELAASRLQLSTAVASAYATLIQATADNVAANDDAKLRDDTRVLVADRMKNGLETRAESSQSEAALASSYVDRQQALAALLHARYELAALIGAGPDATMDLKPDLTIAPTPVGLPADAGSNLIGRRPDIAAARLRVEAAAQKEKVARADFYPNFSLTGSLLAVSVTPQDILSRNLEMAQLGPALSLPLFDSGRLAGALRGARGDYEEAVANYDKAVVQAVRDMIDAITMRQGVLVSLARAREAVAANQEAYRLTNLRYTGGLTPYLSVLTVQNALVTSRRQLADLQAQALIADVTLVRALGGGFQDPASAAHQSNP